MEVTGNTPGESNAHQVRVPCIVFFVITPIFIAIRIWGRLSNRSGIGWDDWTILVSFACALAVQILMMFSCDYGFGQHIYNLSTENKLMALKLFYVAQIFYKVTINLTKTSILLLYLRIFIQRWFRICCYTLMGIILIYMVATTASSIWQCTPVRGAWDKSTHPTCISLTKNWYANAGFSISTDVLILLLPMQPIWASNLSINQKMALVVVFALGGFVTVTSILRSTTLNFSTTTPDTTYDIASSLWTMVEENVAIICACLPMCRRPLAWFSPSSFVSSAKSKGSSNKYSSDERSQTHHDGWKPYVGPQKGEGVSHIAVQCHDAASEEYILSSFPGNGSGGDSSGGDVGTILKTTQYQVTYGRRDD